MATAHPYRRRETWSSRLEYRLRGQGVLGTVLCRGDRARASGLFICAGRRHAAIEDRPGALAA
ncbi:MAG TPA: hypothetical protein DEH03_11095 [Brevundimonas sp.]|nr:hypothetical protein [Brevundimonas sp.]